MFYRFARALCRFVLLTVRRMKVRGLENVPPEGGLVVVSNHKSYWDPVIIGCILPPTRPVHFMAKAELFRIPLLGIAVNHLGAFPVRRGGADRSAIRTALNHLASGQVVGIFPEGTRYKQEGIMDPHLGAAMLATRGNAPVLPVAITGSMGFFGKVKVSVGAPILIDRSDSGGQTRRSSREDLAGISVQIMERVAGLMKS